MVKTLPAKKGNSKNKAVIKVSAKNELRRKREVAGKLRRKNRKISRSKKRKDKLKSTIDPGSTEKVDGEHEDLDDLMDMLDPEYKSTAREKHRDVENSEQIEDDAEVFERAYINQRMRMYDGQRKKNLLPIKTSEGFVARTRDALFEAEEEDVDEKEDDDSTRIENEEPEETVHLTEEERRAKFAANVEEMRIKIGAWSSSLVEDPENNIEHLKHILAILNEGRSSVTPGLRQLAAVSLKEVFVDIIPGYCIQSHDVESKKVKKETLKLWKFENDLLHAYKSYLTKLESFAGFFKRHISSQDPANPNLISNFRTGIVAVNCMKDLLVAHPQFNYAVNLTKIIVNLAAHPHPEIGLPCNKALTLLFRQDNVGEVSLQAVKQLYALSKKKNYLLPARLFEPLLALRLHHVKADEEVRAEMQRKILDKQQEKRLSRREQKERKLVKIVKKDLELTDAEESAQKKEKFQTETLNVVFTIYFRVLKSRPNPKLLSACLEGLAKYSHLINLDFFPDLVNVLHELASQALVDEADMNDDDDDECDSGLGEEDDKAIRVGARLNAWQALHCVRAAFSIVSGEGKSLAIEPIRFYALLYYALLAVNATTPVRDQSATLDTLVTALTDRRKALSTSRCLAFCKRLLTMATHHAHPMALAYMNVCRVFMTTHKATSSLVDFGDDGPAGKDLFNPESRDPEHSMAQTAIAWELGVLQEHYNPVVSKFARHLACGCPPSGKGHLPMELAKLNVKEIFDEFAMGDGTRFRPVIPLPQPPTEKCFKGRSHVWKDPELRRLAHEAASAKCAFAKFVRIMEEVKKFPSEQVSVLARRRKRAESQAKEAKNFARARKIDYKKKKRTTFKHLEEFIRRAENRIQDGYRVQSSLQRRRNLENGLGDLVVVIMIRPVEGNHPSVKKVMSLLRLSVVNSAVFLLVNPATRRLLQIVEPYVTWGTPGVKVVRDLLYKRGNCYVNGKRTPIVSNELVELSLGEHQVICMEDLLMQIVTKGSGFEHCVDFLAPFRLNLPTGNWKKSKELFSKGGECGDRGEEINGLLERMI
ncbi:unnamed protein product [Notodromas monacha]|uniref:NOC3-like protein n=1 Tax=Notodromas monacha TaxID=399045 RepID=A0A7R9BPW1_9CRUS|nr:unnamed protein product [Notodromas monacha]CAG0919455.1 unnamed protein product [Notodromas monacha]